MVKTHDVPVAFSVLACQHRFAEASTGEVRHAKNTFVNYGSLRLQKDVSPNCSKSVRVGDWGRNRTSTRQM